MKSLKSNNSDFYANHNDEDTENRVNNSNYTNTRKYKNNQCITRNSYIWNSNNGSSFGSVNEKHTSEFGKKIAIQPPLETIKHKFDQNDHSSDIPEFTLGPMKFSS
jgi:hypothetical protein